MSASASPVIKETNCPVFTNRNMGDETLRLEVWSGDWDLPSVDPACLATLAYCKFSGVPVKVEKTNRPWRSPTALLTRTDLPTMQLQSDCKLPIMRHKDVVESKVWDIFAYLRKQNWGSDFNLTSKQSADVVAYCAMIENKLLPALTHFWFLESDNYTNITRPRFSRAVYFPFKLWYPDYVHSKARTQLYTSQGTENVTDVEINSKIYKDAKDCLTYLSHKLGSQEFFFGASPTSLDAMVFGYVAPLLNAPLNINQLTNFLHAYCENLCTFCKRILRIYFPLSPSEIEQKQIEEQQKKKAEAESLEYPNKKRNMILAGVFAMTAMLTFAIMNGIIDIQVVDDDDPSS